MIITNYPNLKIEPLKPHAGEVLKLGVEKLENYWVSAGTALGLYREGDLIEGDTDLDIEMVGFEGIEFYIFSNIPLGFSLCRTIYEFEKLMQVAFIFKETIFD